MDFSSLKIERKGELYEVHDIDRTFEGIITYRPTPEGKWIVMPTKTGDKFTYNAIDLYACYLNALGEYIEQFHQEIIPTH